MVTSASSTAAVTGSHADPFRRLTSTRSGVRRAWPGMISARLLGSLCCADKVPALLLCGRWGPGTPGPHRFTSPGGQGLLEGCETVSGQDGGVGAATAVRVPEAAPLPDRGAG